MSTAVSAATPLGSALAYARAGLPVFPCRPNKRPATAHGFKDATTDLERIARFWLKRPDFLVGMPVPDGYVVVDIDAFDGFEELARRGLDLPETLIARTPRGWHYWYRTSAPVAPRVGVVPHVDLRGPGSYVIVPASPGYRWLTIGGIARGLE